MNSKVKKIGLFGALAGLVIAVAVLWISAVDDQPTSEDVKVIEELFGDISCASIDDFEGQVACIRKLQVKLRQEIPNMRCAARNVLIEPAAFVERGYGCCFDRARLLEKALTHMGYSVRRVALFDSSEHGALALAIPQVPSHATLEVLTAAGWMGVDSNELFVLMSKDRKPLTYLDIANNRENLIEQPVPSTFYDQKLIGVYGVYSRHGLSHRPFIPGPEINWEQFFEHNFDAL